MFSERLKKLRKRSGLTQYELAKRLGMSRGKLANYEQGTREPDFDTLKMFANHFNVSTDYLLGHNDEPFNHNDRDTEFDRFVKEVRIWHKEEPDADEKLEMLKEMFKIIRKR